jgi:diguanylate cyclase (GGDEF)-like protein
MPESVEIPAPVNATTRSHRSIQPRTSSTATSPTPPASRALGVHIDTDRPCVVVHEVERDAAGPLSLPAPPHHAMTDWLPISPLHATPGAPLFAPAGAGAGGEAMTVAQLLRAEIPAVVAGWRARCSAGSSPPVPEGADLDAVVSAVALAVDDAPLATTTSRPALDWVAEILMGQGTGLEETIQQLGALREVLTERVVARMGPDAALEAQHGLNAAVDGLVEACAAHTSRRLEQAAFVDPLTGLLNRRAMERDVRRELAVAARHGRRLSVIVGDLDRLKELNDREGHAAGDRALCSLADALRAGLRAGDSAYRLGGDEFLVLLPETSADDVDAVVTRILNSGPPSFSWGAATFPDDAADGASLIHVADRRLFARRRVARAGPRRSMAAPLGRQRREPRLLTSFRLAAALMAGALLGAASVSGATGTLPDAAQDIVHTALDKVGVRVPPGTPAGPSAGPEAGTKDGARSAVRFIGDETTSCTNPDGTPFRGTHGEYVAAHPDDPRTPVNERELAARSPCGKPVTAVAGAESPAPTPEPEASGPTAEPGRSGDGRPPADAGKPAGAGTTDASKRAESGETVEPVTRVDRDTEEPDKTREDGKPAKAQEPDANTEEPGEQDGGSVDATTTEPPRRTRAGGSRQPRPR